MCSYTLCVYGLPVLRNILMCDGGDMTVVVRPCVRAVCMGRATSRARLMEPGLVGHPGTCACAALVRARVPLVLCACVLTPAPGGVMSNY